MASSLSFVPSRTSVYYALLFLYIRRLGAHDLQREVAAARAAEGLHARDQV
jgi:hypothetical protein